MRIHALAETVSNFRHAFFNYYIKQKTNQLSLKLNKKLNENNIE